MDIDDYCSRAFKSEYKFVLILLITVHFPVCMAWIYSHSVRVTEGKQAKNRRKDI